MQRPWRQPPVLHQGLGSGPHSLAASEILAGVRPPLRGLRSVSNSRRADMDLGISNAQSETSLSPECSSAVTGIKVSTRSSRLSRTAHIWRAPRRRKQGPSADRHRVLERRTPHLAFRERLRRCGGRPSRSRRNGLLTFGKFPAGRREFLRRLPPVVGLRPALVFIRQSLIRLRRLFTAQGPPAAQIVCRALCGPVC